MATALQLKPFDPKATMPPFTPYNGPGMQYDATQTAEQTAEQSKAFQKTITPGWSAALKVGQQDILNDATGDTTLNPEMQSQAIRAGISGSLNSFGDQGATLTPGSAATANVSTNLFGDANALDQQVRSNQYRALTVGNQLFPEQQIGLSGEDAAAIDASNTQGQNSYNQAQYDNTLENERFNYNVQADNLQTTAQQNNINAQASAAASANTQQTAIEGGAAVAGIAVLAIAL